ncbi:hypothetical protein SPONN_2365 [uncultured Candidatus Thioglobus sp.]|nr:hypothetical protein SPONN_2365 [uncultured Candidatus Thioglobus sp.]
MDLGHLLYNNNEAAHASLLLIINFYTSSFNFQFLEFGNWKLMTLTHLVYAP